MSSPLANLLAVEKTAEDVFVTKKLPRPMGNTVPIAYGGCTTGYIVEAACMTVADNFHIYSMLGHFLGPARIDRKVHCRVTRTRDTRTFATRRVIAFQLQEDGSERSCSECVIDFHVKEPALLTYSKAPPTVHRFGPYDRKHTASMKDVIERAVMDGRATREAAIAHSKLFDMLEEFFEWSQCLEGVSAQNALGLAKKSPTTQDHLPIQDKSSNEWMRLRGTVSTPAESAGAMAFLMDGGISFLPLHLNFMDFSDTGACSTLDFALRIFAPNFDLSKWHLRERTTVAAAAGRTFSEAKLWDEGGNMVAIMSQTSVLRPLPSNEASRQAKI